MQLAFQAFQKRSLEIPAFFVVNYFNQGCLFIFESTLPSIESWFHQLKGSSSILRKRMLMLTRFQYVAKNIEGLKDLGFQYTVEPV